MRRTREYYDTFFTSETIQKCFAFFHKSLLTDLHKRYLVKQLTTEISGLIWEYDTDEALFEAYIPAVTSIVYKKTFLDYEFMLYTIERSTFVGLKAQRLAQMQPIFDYIDSCIPADVMTRREALQRLRPLIVIFHGQDDTWKELLAYLYGKQGYAVKAYEVTRTHREEVREVMELAGGENMFVCVIPDPPGAREDFQALNHGLESCLSYMKEAVDSDRILCLCGESNGLHYGVAGVDVVYFKNRHIKQVFWQVLDKVHRIFGGK
ncbi:MAG: hypothetical protein DRG76_06105 [Deltaproteobacteria bacterium]|nr:MAG: hypothetical protein DRG76_06105 [Deltaproteobacteria bacterium]